MSTARISGYNVSHIEQTVFKLFAKNAITKWQASHILKKLSTMLNNATDELESVVQELNQMVLGD